MQKYLKGCHLIYFHWQKASRTDIFLKTHQESKSTKMIIRETVNMNTIRLQKIFGTSK